MYKYISVCTTVGFSMLMFLEVNSVKLNEPMLNGFFLMYFSVKFPLSGKLNSCFRSSQLQNFVCQFGNI